LRACWKGCGDERLLIVADRIVTGFAADGRPEILDGCAILVEGEAIAAIGPAAALRQAHPDVPEVGGRGRVAIPGLVNAHHHVG
jgi:5-methylthioadenosine/S-adenosylhomocysteine deaminase